MHTLHSAHPSAELGSLSTDLWARSQFPGFGDVDSTTRGVPPRSTDLCHQLNIGKRLLPHTSLRRKEATVLVEHTYLSFCAPAPSNMHTAETVPAAVGNCPIATVETLLEPPGTPVCVSTASRASPYQSRSSGLPDSQSATIASSPIRVGTPSLSRTMLATSTSLPCSPATSCREAIPAS